MDGKKEIYADGIGQLHYAGSMVRFDFMTLEPGLNGAAPTPVSSLRVIMPPQGFLTAFTSMQQLIDKMVEAGALTRTPAAAQTAEAPVKAAEAPAKEKSKGKSKSAAKSKAKK